MTPFLFWLGSILAGALLIAALVLGFIRALNWAFTQEWWDYGDSRNDSR